MRELIPSPVFDSIRTHLRTVAEEADRLGGQSGIEGGHALRFRDTFAVAMLEEGKTLQDVADRLGITLAVAQKHYNPWSRRRQEQANADVRVTWANDPLLKMLEAEARGTSEVCEKVERLR